MELLPDKLREQLPRLYANEEIGLDAPALVKFFTPDAQWTWYASEFDGEDIFFGLVIGLEIEFGYFSLSELKAVRGPLGLPIERDKFFEIPDSQNIEGSARAAAPRPELTGNTGGTCPLNDLDHPVPNVKPNSASPTRRSLFDRIGHGRFMTLLAEEATSVHRILESSNNYGEFLFVTLSRPGSRERLLVTFWGLGYHDYRERWLSDEWFWYFSNPLPREDTQVILKEDAQRLIEARLAYVQTHASHEAQSRRGQIFELLADLTDEDGAYSEMDDLPGWLLEDE